MNSECCPSQAIDVQEDGVRVLSLVSDVIPHGIQNVLLAVACARKGRRRGDVVVEVVAGLSLDICSQ